MSEQHLKTSNGSSHLHMNGVNGTEANTSLTEEEIFNNLQKPEVPVIFVLGENRQD